MKKTIIIIGGSKSQTRFIGAAKRKGYVTLVFDKAANSPGAEISDYFLPISTNNFKLIIKQIELFKKSFR